MCKAMFGFGTGCVISISPICVGQYVEHSLDDVLLGLVKADNL